VEEVITLGGTLAWIYHILCLSTWMLALGGLDITYPNPYVIEEIKVSMEEVLAWYFGMFGHDLGPLEAKCYTSLSQRSTLDA
jgi:hypothetical protein